MACELLDEIETKILPSGLKIIALKKGGAPVVSFQVWYKTGSVNESENIRGVSHFLEHMMFRGSKKYASEKHTAMVNRTGGNCNAFTAEDMTAYLNNVPSDHLSMVIKLEADRMRNLLFDKKLFETERKVIIEEYHTYMNNPVASSFLKFRSHFYKDMPYETSPVGLIENIERINIEQMNSYYHLHYQPYNATVVVVGKIKDTKSLFDEIETEFSNKISNSSDVIDYSTKFDFSKREKFSLKKRIDFEVPLFLVGTPAPASSDSATLSLDIMQSILSQGETSRLNKNMVRKDSIAVMAGGMNHLLKYSGMSLFFALFTPDVSVSKVENALNREIDKVITHGVSNEEIQMVKDTALTGRYYDFFSAETICQKLGFAETVDGDYKSWVKKITDLEKLTPENIVEDVKQYWNSENRSTLYLQPKKVNPLLFAMGLTGRFIKGLKK